LEITIPDVVKEIGLNSKLTGGSKPSFIRFALCSSLVSKFGFFIFSKFGNSGYLAKLIFRKSCLNERS
jgi:hypothetical protein